MAKTNYIRENMPLSRFGVLVAQLESIVASAGQQSAETLLCFDLLSDLIFAIDEEPKESILLWQRKCEDALHSLLVLGARRPVRHLASVAVTKIISKGDGISIYSRASSLQGFLSDGKRNEPQKVAGAAQCLGELYRHFGRRITSGLLETTMIATKLFKFHEEFVRREALNMLQNALEGCGGNAASSAYVESFRLIMRSAVGDKSFGVRIAAARCLKAFANIGGPGLGVSELENSALCCVKALEDPVSSVRDAFAEALGSLLALGMNPEAQVLPRGKGPFPPAKKWEGCLQRHLVLPFTKANGIRSRDLRVGITLSWVFFLQAMRLKYQHPDSELKNFALQVMDMLRTDANIDSHALACVIYILRIGVTDLMTEPTQRDFLVFLGKQLQSPEASSFMKTAALRTVSYTLKTLGEVTLEFKDILDDTVVAAVSYSSQTVRIEAALALRTLAEVDPTCVGGLTSYSVTALNALRENISFEKGSNLQFELDYLHGQAAVLAALVSISPVLPLGYPSRLPKSVLAVAKRMVSESSRNPMAASVEKEAGWLLLAALLAALPKEELEDQVFDILSLWASLFSRSPELEVKQTGDLTSRIGVWSASVDALTAFIRCFLHDDVVNNGVLLQPILVYLSRALSYISAITCKDIQNTKPAVDIFIIKTIIAYRSLPDPMSYKNDHPQIIELCTTPFRYPYGCEESSCLRLLLDKRDAWLGPWIPGRDWFEDELRAFQGGKDGLMPSIYDEPSSFPQPETISKILLNQKLLFFGVMFASQDKGGMLSLLGMMEQCLKAGKKQQCHSASITNICVGLLAGFKALLSSRVQPIGQDILNLAQSIFQSILMEGDICSSQRRASSEGLGYLARLGNDIFTAKMTRSLLGDLNGATDSNYAGSIAFALGCIHRSAGGMALSSLVPSTVGCISSLAKSAIVNLKIWSLHGLLLTIEAAGLSFVSHVQAALGLAIDILLSDENGFVNLQRGVGCLINAVVAVLGPELAPGSIFFSRCKSVVAEISSWQETATMLECARFTQQLVIFAPQAVSVHTHVQTLLPSLSSRQLNLRHIAVSTLRHLIEKDPASIIEEHVEDDLFHMLDEETDSEIGNLLRGTLVRLLNASCPSHPSHWMTICRKVVLATSTRKNVEGNGNPVNDNRDDDTGLNFGDDENMVSTVERIQPHTFGASTMSLNRDKHLRYRTRVFAAECLSRIPEAVGRNPAHFDLLLAREEHSQGQDWLVLHLQELISLAYQISTIQFENMRPIGVALLGTIVDKFKRLADPELPGHLLLEQYQAQLVSAVRTTLDTSTSPSLLEAGLHLATKILTSGIISGDQAVVKRIFSLISRPLNEFEDLYYPSFSEWVSSKIKIRLLAAHASLKCHVYAFLRRHHERVPDEYLALVPLFSESSSVLGRYWIHALKDYSYIYLSLLSKKNSNLFFDGLQSTLVSSKLQPCFEESWPVILQALALDAVPRNLEKAEVSRGINENELRNSSASGYRMVDLELEEFQFLWGFSLCVLFQSHHPNLCKPITPSAPAVAKGGGELPMNEMSSLNLHEIVLPVFQFLSSESFFRVGFLTADICSELLWLLLYTICLDSSWNGPAMSILLQVVQNCPDEFLDTENFAYLTVELCLAYIFKLLQSNDAVLLDHPNEHVLHTALSIVKTLMNRFETKMQKQLKSVSLAFVLVGYKCIREASTELCLSEIMDTLNCTCSLKKKLFDGESKVDDSTRDLILGTCLNVISSLTKDCIEGFHLSESKRSNLFKKLESKLAFSLEQMMHIAKLTLEVGCLEEEKDSDSISFSTLRYCTGCIKTVLMDSSLQVQAIGLQVLINMIQKGANVEDNSSIIFLSGEFIGDAFTIIQRILKNPITKESVTLASECLRFLALLHTLSRKIDCQRGFMNLLFEAIVMVFLSTKDGVSAEVNELRSTAVRLVSRLAQIHASAAHFKDVLLSMAPMQRQQLQDIIRASLTQDNKAIGAKPVVTLLEVKIPTQAEGNDEKHSIPSTSIAQTDDSNVGEEEEDEDDWDTFQSFPASANAGEESPKPVYAVEDPSLADTSSNMEGTTGTNEFQECLTSEPLRSAKEINVDACPEAVEEEVLSDAHQVILCSSQSYASFDRAETEARDSQVDISVTQSCGNRNQEMEEEPGLHTEERLASNHEKERDSSANQPVDNDAIGENIAEDPENRSETSGINIEQPAISDPPANRESCHEDVNGKGNREQHLGSNEDARKKTVTEDEVNDHLQENEDCSVVRESEDSSPK